MNRKWCKIDLEKMKLVTNSWLDISVRAVGGGSDCAGATLDVGRTDIGFDGAIDGVL